MSRIIYNKLIRDKIPAIIDDSKRQFKVEIFSDNEFDVALREKLAEESQEVIQADTDHLIIELADAQEIIYSLMEFHQITLDDLNAARLQRLQERGGFTKRLKLLWTD